MQQTVDRLREIYKGIRNRRGASLSLIENIQVECYGTRQPLQYLACIGSRQDALIVEPYDTTIIPAISKAIYDSDIGLMPQSAKTSIRIPIPQLDYEQREKLAKYAKQLAEEHRIAVRNIRRNLRKQGTSDDDANCLTQKYIDEIDMLLEAKLSNLL